MCDRGRNSSSNCIFNGIIKENTFNFVSISIYLTKHLPKNVGAARCLRREKALSRIYVALKIIYDTKNSNLSHSLACGYLRGNYSFHSAVETTLGKKVTSKKRVLRNGNMDHKWSSHSDKFKNMQLGNALLNLIQVITRPEVNFTYLWLIIALINNTREILTQR